MTGNGANRTSGMTISWPRSTRSRGQKTFGDEPTSLVPAALGEVRQQFGLLTAVRRELGSLRSRGGTGVPHRGEGVLVQTATVRRRHPAELPIDPSGKPGSHEERRHEEEPSRHEEPRVGTSRTSSGRSRGRESVHGNACTSSYASLDQAVVKAPALGIKNVSRRAAPLRTPRSVPPPAPADRRGR
jgi:hypothetical protein